MSDSKQEQGKRGGRTPQRGRQQQTPSRQQQQQASAVRPTQPASGQQSQASAVGPTQSAWGQQSQASTVRPPQPASQPTQKPVWGRPATAPTSSTVTTSSILTTEEEIYTPKPGGSKQLGSETGETSKVPPSIPTQTPSKPQPQPQQSEIKSIDESIQQLRIGSLLPDIHGYPQKPKERCSLGREIRLLANHYGFIIKKPFHVYHYDITINNIYLNKKTNKEEQKEIKTREVAKYIFKQLIVKYPNHGNKLFFDFKKNLYSMEEFPNPLEIKTEIPELNDKKYLVKIKKSNEITVNVNQVLDTVVLQILQLIFTNNFNFRFVPVIRSFFSSEYERKNLGFNIDLWRGFYASVRPSEMGFNLNVDVANTVFFNSSDVIDLACQWYNCAPNQLHEAFKQDYNGRSFMNDVLAGRKVKTHLNYSKSVEKFGPNAVEHTFMVGEIKMTIEEYFKKQGKVLKYPKLPCLCLGKENYTPMELCRTELTNVRKLDPKQTSDMIRATAVPAYNRKNDVETMIRNSQVGSDPILKHYNIELKYQMANVGGRVLNAPDLEYGANRITLSREIGNKGQWDNMNKKFFDAKELSNWIIINCGRSIRQNTIEDFVYSLQTVANTHGIRINDPIDIVQGDNRYNEQRALEAFMKISDKYKTANFFMVLLSGTTVIYKALKTFGDINKGIITQAIDENSINKQRGRYDRLASNICLKINSKLGGRNFKLSKLDQLFQTYLLGLYNGPLMIFGADVNHPSPVDKETSESIAAVVGSIDMECCYYAARMQAQQQPKGKALELIIDLRIMVEELLREYHKSLGRFPKSIVFLRDGVSEGQFKITRNHEINEIRRACQNIASDYKPAVTFIVVQKGHHTRFFPFDKKDESGKHGNVPPGTLVDRTVVSPDLYDFFLCSHMGIQGTSKPCHYYVLHDENKFTMNQVTLLCHYLCHIYSRSTTSVSYPAPTYYADLCAARGREYIRARIGTAQAQTMSRLIETHSSFRNKMFYI